MQSFSTEKHGSLFYWISGAMSISIYGFDLSNYVQSYCISIWIIKLKIERNGAKKSNILQLFDRLTVFEECYDLFFSFNFKSHNEYECRHRQVYVEICGSKQEEKTEGWIKWCR